MPIQKSHCANYNHGRRDAPVRFCTMCGEVVNPEIPIKGCDTEKHAKSRRNRTNHCSDCGEQLVREIGR